MNLKVIKKEWNMPERVEVEFNKVMMFCLILAPKAKVIDRGDNIIGKIVCKLHDVERTQIIDIDFDACIPDIPIEEEPITVTVYDFVSSKTYTAVTTTSEVEATNYSTINNLSSTVSVLKTIVLSTIEKLLPLLPVLL